jgi:hypothetical protein
MIAAIRTERRCSDCGEPFTAGPQATLCPICRPLHCRTKTVKYRLDGYVCQLLRERYDSRVRGRAGEIARQLSWPDWAVKKAARQLGLSTPWSKDRRLWTAAEVKFLKLWEGRRSAMWIARRLGRGETSVILKFKRLRLSRRVREGYSIYELAECFGVNDHTARRWINRGWIRAVAQGTAREHDVRRISENQILRFVRQHPLEFRLDKVHQLWFLGLLLGPPAVEGATEKDELQNGNCKMQNAR